MKTEQAISSGPHPSPNNLSFTIIVLNEAANLPRCLKSLPPQSEIIVVDSQSTDETCAIARDFGAHVHVRPFTTYAEQKNFAASLATRNFVFSIDADEELDGTLRSALLSASNETTAVALRVQRRLVFMGRKMRFGRTVDRLIRGFPRGKARFQNAIHEVLMPDAAVPIRDLPGEILHYSYRDLTDYFERFNRYTSRVAQRHFQENARSPALLPLILRPWTEFFTRYVLKLGLLDGYPGYVYALNASLYAFTKYAKLRELEQKSL